MIKLPKMSVKNLCHLRRDGTVDLVGWHNDGTPEKRSPLCKKSHEPRHASWTAAGPPPLLPWDALVIRVCRLIRAT